MTECFLWLLAETITSYALHGRLVRHLISANLAPNYRWHGTGLGALLHETVKRGEILS